MSEAGYRAAQRRCPVCAAPLRERLLDGVHVDVCSDCSGVWIDWMDGELASVAAKLDLPAARGPARDGDDRCPICATELAAETLLQDVEILRCGSCAGAFLTRSAIARLHEPGREEADGAAHAKRDPFLTRLLDALARLLKA